MNQAARSAFKVVPAEERYRNQLTSAPKGAEVFFSGGKRFEVLLSGQTMTPELNSIAPLPASIQMRCSNGLSRRWGEQRRLFYNLSSAFSSPDFTSQYRVFLNP